MKKAILFILSFAMIFSAFGASAASVPVFMTQPYDNYTADYTVSVSFESGEQIALLLEELGVFEYMSRYVDIKTFLNTLLSAESKVNVQLRMSDDYRSADLAMTGECTQAIDVNRNLTMDYNAKTGMWMHMNLDKEEFTVIYSTPVNQKYMVFDASGQLPEEARAEVFGMLGKIFSKDFIDGITSLSAKLLTEHADISMKGSKCTVKYDNDAFIAMINSSLDYAFAQLETLAAQYGGEMTKPQIPSLDGIELLGDGGITYTYYLKGTKISRGDVEADICINLEDIYAGITGEEWPYAAEGKIELKINSRADFTKLGSTNPVMPEITEENSFSMIDPSLFYEQYAPYEEEPYVWSYSYCWDVPEVCENGVYYVPLRSAIEDAYYNSSDITYKRGDVGITLQNPEGVQKLSFYTGDNKVFVSGSEEGDFVTYTTEGTHRIVDGSVYVSIDFFEKCLGWQVEEMSKNLLAGTMSYGFYTGR